MPLKLYNSLPGSSLYTATHKIQDPQDVTALTLTRGANAVHTEGSLEQGDVHGKSMYSATYVEHPSEAYNTTRLTMSAPVPTKGAAPWAEPGSSSLGKSTYDSEILHGGETAASQLAEVQDVPCTTVDYQAAHRHGATEHSKTRTTAGLLGPAGFRTEYESAMGTRTIPQMTVSGMWGAKSINNSQTLGANVNDPSDHLIKAHGSGASGVPLGAAALQGARSSYTQDMGPVGHDPLERTAQSADTMTKTASTQDIATSTVRSAPQRIPGYAGHVGTLGATGRLSNEVVNRAHEPSTLLLELSQYSRERVPGCTKYMPRSVRNIRPAPPAQPMLDEDWAQCTAGGSQHAINSRKGIISFFNTGTGPFESENGLTEAQQFFQTNRLSGRRFKM